MKVFVLNCGSSSIKYKLYDMDNKKVMAAGGIEKIGLPGSFLKTKKPVEEVIFGDIFNHNVGLEIIFQSLTDPKKGVLKNLSEIDAVGHRIAHGGRFTKSLELTHDVLEEWKQYEDLAPLHNPAHLKGIVAAEKKLPGVTQVGVFDTSFHQTMPEYAYRYALPWDVSEKYNIRRYGFHGTSHRYVLHRAGEFLGFNPEEKRVISCHIGNGASVCAIDHGRSVDTSMGLTPLEGLVMGTRTGDIDPSAILYLMDKMKLDTKRASDLLNKQSGMMGLTGHSSDMREILERAEQGDERCRLANEIYNYRLKKYICAYIGVLGGVDCIIFTAGVGEHQWDIREESLKGLEFLGIKLDLKKNKQVCGEEAVISAPDSKVTVVVIPTDEEQLVALDTMNIALAKKGK